MRAIRIVLGELSPLARDLLRDLFASQADMQVLDASRGVGATDVVINHRPPPTGNASWVDVVLAEPRQNVLALTIDGKRVMMFEIRPHQPSLYDPSPEALLAAIRAAVRSWPQES